MRLSERLTPEVRTSVYYFTIFMAAGVGTVYGGIWLQGKGMTPGQIGIINAVPVLIMLGLNMIVGRIADRAGDWRTVIIIGSLIAAVVPLGLFAANGFWPILIVWALNALPMAATLPVADAATIAMTRRRGSDFGTIRAFATVGYLIMLLATGYITGWFGAIAYIWLFLAAAAIRGGASLLLPKFRAAKDEAAAPPAAAIATHLFQVMKPWFLFPLVGWAMIYGALMVLANFQGLIWKREGIDEQTIAILIAIGAVSEALMMFGYRFLATRFKARQLILFSAIVMGARLIAMAFSPPVWALVFLQSLHALNYALGIMASMSFIANWTSEDISAEAQSFFVVLQQAMSVVALIAFGWLMGLFGAYAYAGLGLFSFIGAGLIFLSLRMQPGRPAAAA